LNLSLFLQITYRNLFQNGRLKQRKISSPLFPDGLCVAVKCRFAVNFVCHRDILMDKKRRLWQRFVFSLRWPAPSCHYKEEKNLKLSIYDHFLIFFKYYSFHLLYSQSLWFVHPFTQCSCYFHHSLGKFSFKTFLSKSYDEKNVFLYEHVSLTKCTSGSIFTFLLPLIVHFEIIFWYVLAYLKGFQDVGVFVSAVV